MCRQNSLHETTVERKRERAGTICYSWIDLTDEDERQYEYKPSCSVANINKKAFLRI